MPYGADSTLQLYTMCCGDKGPHPSIVHALMSTVGCPRRCNIDLEAVNPDFNEGSLLDDLGRFRGASSFTGMHRTYAGASVLVATKPAELAPGLRLLEVPATCRPPLNIVVWSCTPYTRQSFAAVELIDTQHALHFC